MQKFLLVALALLLVLTGCGQKTEELTANLETSVYFAVGQTVAIPSEHLKIRFSEVMSDSRCPQGATCIWAGEASILLEITISGANYKKTIIQSGESAFNQTDFQNYSFEYILTPYPQQGKKIAQKDYRLQLTINQKS